MGYGDNIMATGMARGAAARGKQIAFGNGNSIIWDVHSEAIFRNNPNIARPGEEKKENLEWINFYKGHRIYNKMARDKWKWNYNFKAQPGEIFFSKGELDFANSQGSNFIIVEPNVPRHKSVASNKQWSRIRYEKLTRYLAKGGYDVRQFEYPDSHRLAYATPICTSNFRLALAVLSKARLYIGPEGGLHHGAAAVNIPAVVIFGGFIPPQVTGYDAHTNLTANTVACGSLRACLHCSNALQDIKVDDVHSAALKHLGSKSNG